MFDRWFACMFVRLCVCSFFRMFVTVFVCPFILLHILLLFSVHLSRGGHGKGGGGGGGGRVVQVHNPQHTHTERERERERERELQIVFKLPNALFEIFSSKGVDQYCSTLLYVYGVAFVRLSLRHMNPVLIFIWLKSTSSRALPPPPFPVAPNVKADNM